MPPLVKGEVLLILNFGRKKYYYVSNATNIFMKGKRACILSQIEADNVLNIIILLYINIHNFLVVDNLENFIKHNILVVENV